MAIVYNNDLKDARLQLIADTIDAETAPGTLEVCTAGYAAVLATIELADPCGTVTDQVLTFDTPQSTAATDTGTAAVARIKDGSGEVVISGLTVGTMGTDIIITSTTINEYETVTFVAGTISA